MKTIEERRSIRKFEDRPVPADILDQIIEAARLAPSGTNRQPWRFALLQESQREKIASAVVQPFVVEAPAVFVCCLDHRAYLRSHVEDRMKELVRAEVISEEAAGYIYQRRMPEQVEEVRLPASAYIDLGIAVQNMVIAAASLGLGSCWVRLFNQEQVQQSLALPDHMEALVLLPVGYPAQNPPPRPRLSRDEIMIEVKD